MIMCLVFIKENAQKKIALVIKRGGNVKNIVDAQKHALLNSMVASVLVNVDLLAFVP